jgi:molybdate transport system ATP-binding protein
MPRQEVRLGHRVGALEIDVEFSLTKPWTILFGPSGSGKSTVLRILAGLVQPHQARIVSIGGSAGEPEQRVVWVDTAQRIFLPPQKRRVRYAPQRATLFPHRTVLENVGYGLAGPSGDPGGDGGRQQVLRTLTEFGIAELADKRPPQLSGGEAQRVNLARAAASCRGRRLLLDEPFTGLELTLRERILGTLAARSGASQILSVTHDISEAFQLGAEVIKMAEGRVVEQGPVEVVLGAERERLLAQLGGSPGNPLDSQPHLAG